MPSSSCATRPGAWCSRTAASPTATRRRRMTEAAAPTPRESYVRDLGRPGFVTDPAQARAVEALQKVYDELLAKPPKRRLGTLKWPRVQGLYLWGSVGRGKTWLMDAFCEALPFTRKRR